jgi:hypothetical protein
MEIGGVKREGGGPEAVRMSHIAPFGDHAIDAPHDAQSPD